MNALHALKRPLFAAALAAIAAAGTASAQGNSLRYTDVKPYTGTGVPVGSDGAPGAWKGTLSRVEVIDAMQQARSEGMIPAGEALNYPFALKGLPADTPTASQVDGQVLGGPPAGAAGDGYQFVGGEAGWIHVGSRRAQP